MKASKISPILTDKSHTSYSNFGKYSTPAIQCMQRMLSLTAPETPDVAASGATTQWANGPTAPPLGAPILKGLRGNALNGSIGSLDMATLHVGSLVDKIKGVRNEHSTRSDRE